MKQKTTKAIAKRVKRTGSGKLVHVKSAKSHLLTHKNDPTKTLIVISQADTAKVKKLAPYL